MRGSFLKKYLFAGGLILILGFAAINIFGTTPTPSPTPQPSPNAGSTTGNFFKDIVRDQKAIWTAPFHAKSRDLKWILPLGGVTAVLFATDRKTANAVPTTGDWEKVSRDISYIGSGYATAGVSAGMYLLGKAIKNEKLRDTGRLAAEALIDTAAVTQVFKYGMGRERPFVDAGRGRFFEGGQSFFSGHASSSFAVASVLACQYDDNPWIKFGAYGIASAVAVSRYTGHKHFLSDVLVGSVVGYEIGNYVCKNRQTKPAATADPDPNISANCPRMVCQ